ncbi:MAG: PTS fructose transporter subunit IIA, partial [Erysipelotrichaceae bacterium]|nr:PTS fructose transporter subunit IIA [Solobacterium sp.]MDY3793685.1 PTS fructose transporter subunit IIA [Erysipelotrichaceae bacterium]
AAIVTAGNPKVKVIAGTNLPMLCEISMARTMINDLDMLVSSALSVGKDNIQLFEIQNTSNYETSDEDGI